MYICFSLHHKTIHTQCTSAFPCITKQNTFNVHPHLLALQNNTHLINIRFSVHHKTIRTQCTSAFTCISKYTLHLPGFHSVVKQNTTNDISSIYNLTIRIRIMKTKHVQSPYRTTESSGATTTPPYSISFEVMM